MSNRFPLSRLILLLLILASCKSKQADAQVDKSNMISSKEKDQLASRWADSIYRQLNETERIGQLFMVAAYSGGEKFNQPLIEKLLSNHQIGGVIFMQGTPEKQAALTNKYQQMAQVPLLIGMDAEWGLGMRLTGVKNYPRQMMIGATRDTALMYEIGKASAEQCKQLGVHVNFAPDIDVNNNPANPVINFRSFGEDKEWVSAMGIAYMRGLQENGVMACAKHFPGHGDVATDSHLDLPKIDKPMASLEAVELYPFRRLIDAGVQSVMIAHLDVPAIDPTPHLPTTLSYKTVTDLLKNKMGFKGLVFTDALNMQGVTKYFPDGETDLRAFLAGNDMLLFSQDVPLAINKIQQAIKDGRVTETDLKSRVIKILRAKFEAGLGQFKPIIADNLTENINKQTAAIWEKTARQSVTLVKDENDLLRKLHKKEARIACYSLDSASNDFCKGLSGSFTTITQLKDLPETIAAKYDVVIMNIHASALYPGKDGHYGLSQQSIEKLRALSKLPNVMTIVFGNVYALQFACNAGTIIAGYEANEYSYKAITDVLTGKLIPQGKLPVTPCP